MEANVATTPEVAAAVANTVAPKRSYVGSQLADAQSKFNSWGSGIPRGRYSDAVNESNVLETFGYQTNADGSVKVSETGKPVTQSRPDGSPMATGRFIVNAETNGRYKLYNSQLASLSPTQLLAIRDTELDAVVFDNTELEVTVEVKDGRSSFKFNM